MLLLNCITRWNLVSIDDHIWLNWLSETRPTRANTIHGNLIILDAVIMTLSIGHASFNQSGTRDLPYSSLNKSLLRDRESAPMKNEGAYRNKFFFL